MKYGILMAALAVSSYASAVPDRGLFKRLEKQKFDTAQNTCGPAAGFNCDTKTALRCCSSAGYCGNSDLHCGTGCQAGFGKCGITPPVEMFYQRELLGNVRYGTIIKTCTQPMTIAFGMSNGPHIYTQELLDTLRAENVKVTFFLDGNNYGPIDSPANSATVKRMYAEGHQVATQGNVHKDFNTLSKAQKQAELSKFEELVQPMIGGQSPTYFRPPYFNCNDECIEVATSMGYHVITANLDPRDYDHQDDISPSEQYFKNAFKKAKEEKSTEGYIAVMADVYVNTVKKLVPFAIKKARSKGYRIVTVAECLGDTRKNWYRPYLKDGRPVGSTPATKPGSTTPATKPGSTTPATKPGSKNCKPGWYGDYCDKCSPGYSGPSCTKPRVCDGNYTGDNCATCKTGWSGHKCDQCATGYVASSDGTKCNKCDT